MRIGHGFDIHKFTQEAKPLYLGGVLIPDAPGLLAHSDGDVVLHALCDALLGAAGLGDIGQHFPDTDAKWRGADSTQFITQVYARLQAQGYTLANADITVVAQIPRLSPHIAAIRAQIAELLCCDVQQINVKATTMEGLGPIGERQALATHAVVLLSHS